MMQIKSTFAMGTRSNVMQQEVEKLLEQLMRSKSRASFNLCFIRYCMRHNNELEAKPMSILSAFFRRYRYLIETLEFRFPPNGTMLGLIATSRCKKLQCQVHNIADAVALFNILADVHHVNHLKSLTLLLGPVHKHYMLAIAEGVKSLLQLTHLKLDLSFANTGTREALELLNRLQEEALSLCTLEVKVNLTWTDECQASIALLQGLALLVERRRPTLSLVLSFHGSADMLNLYTGPFHQFLNSVRDFPGTQLETFELSGVSKAAAQALVQTTQHVPVGSLQLTRMVGLGSLKPMLNALPEANIDELRIYDVDGDGCRGMEESEIVDAYHRNTSIVSASLFTCAHSLTTTMLAPIVDRNKDLAVIRGDYIPLCILPEALSRLGQKTLGSTPAYLLLRSELEPCLEYSPLKPGN